LDLGTRRKGGNPVIGVFQIPFGQTKGGGISGGGGLFKGHEVSRHFGKGVRKLAKESDWSM